MAPPPTVFFIFVLLCLTTRQFQAQADDASLFTSTFYVEYTNGIEPFSRTSTQNLIRLAAHDALVSTFKPTIDITEVRVMPESKAEPSRRRVQEDNDTNVLEWARREPLIITTLYVEGTCRGGCPSISNGLENDATHRRLGFMTDVVDTLEDLIQNDVESVNPSMTITTFVQIS